MTQLMTPHDLSGLHLPNRVVMAPMTRVRSGADGLATPSMATYYAQRATAGLLVSEGVHPHPVGQSNPHTPGLVDDAQVASWRQVTGAVHANGGRIFAQLMHGGRIGHPDVAGHQPVGPSAVAAPGTTFTPSGPQALPVPRALPIDEVGEHAGSYADAAARAVSAGFDGVELHGANGYLIAQFLSSNANLREDRYGASIAGRIRFAVEAAEATADAVGGHRVGIRLNPGGGIWGIEEHDTRDLYLALLAELARLDLAYVHLEATTDDETLLALRRAWPGTLVLNPTLPGGPVRTEKDAAESWLSRGADLISFGRRFIANPDLVERLRTDAPLADDDEATWYAGGDAGYVDYPAYQRSA